MMKFRSAATRLLAFSFALCASAVSAQDIKIETDEDALFGDEGAGVETVATEEKGKAVSTFLKTESVRIGGTFSGSLDSSWTWTDPWNDGAGQADESALTPEADATVFFDARPDEHTRYYGSVKLAWPYADSADARLFELFADFGWKDKAYLRFGKQTVKWGVGYFWSPADVINLTAIDLEDPTAQREGPVAARLHVPVPNTQNNFWAYAIVPTASTAEDAADLKPEDLAAAAKYEFLIKNYELGIGGFYQKDTAPKAMLTATGSLWKFGVFGEAVLGWGSSRTLVTGIGPVEPFIDLERDKDDPYFSGTAGLSYIDSENNLTAYAQYFYNGEAYTDADRKDLISTARAALEYSGSLETTMTDALKALIYQSGRHYGAAYVSRSRAFLNDLTLSVLAVGNLSDLSGFIQPTAEYEFFDGFTMSLSPTFVWTTDALWGAGEDGEYAVLSGGPAVTIAVKATLGSGKF